LPQERADRSRVLGEIVDKWFVENTFSSSEFADLRRLVEAKERQNLRISVGLPTLNEEATIRQVIRAIRSRLVERFPLIDELAVIDSRSDDRTRKIAEDEGVPVFIHDEILPETGTYRGKGEGLWKSLQVLTGDIVVWIDTDVTSAHPKFVYGIVGPLLLRPDLQFVKAFYQRPLRIGEAQNTNLLEEANFTMKLIAASGGKLHLEMHDIIDVERPPISTVPGYRAMHKLDTPAD